jgi:predicted O-linked N-acetylglucosamine transferase (SPINDLY family)
MMTVQQAFELAVGHHRAGRLAEAEALYRQLLSVQPGHLDALNNLGIALGCQERMGEAAEVFRRVVALMPAHADSWNNLGITLAADGRFAEAMEAYSRSLALVPNQPEAYNNLGNAYKELGQIEQAEAAYRRALAERSQDADVLRNLGNALRIQGRVEEAIAIFQRALSVTPDDAKVHNDLSIALSSVGQLDEALAAAQRAVGLDPGFADGHVNLGNVLKDRGEVLKAIDAFRRALVAQPGNAAARDNLIYTLEFAPGVDEGTIEAEKECWRRQMANPLAERPRWGVVNRDSEKRLRIGYLSPDFRDHVVGRNLLPLFKEHDRRLVEIISYSGVLRSDAMTAQFRELSDGWRSTLGVPDEALAGMIRDDGIDILVDLAQHMAGNRLPVFSRRPAPVQVSCAGYPAGTATEAIEYRISDRYLEGGAAKDTPRRERIFWLDSFWCYDPCGMEIEINASPARGGGHVTFGGLNNYCKVNDSVLMLWARLLGQLGESRLVILSPRGSHRQHALKIFAAQGVDEDRIEFVEPCARREYLKLYHRIDVVLDPFPYNGHTTNLDALWMGVPVVSLAGTRAVSRAGLSQLSNLGLSEFVAFNEDEYVAIATRLAGNLPQLAEWRTTLRRRMEASVLMDAPRFARQIEEAYRAMWRAWCSREEAMS